MNFSEEKARETIEEAIHLVWEAIIRRGSTRPDIPPLPDFRFLWRRLCCSMQDAREEDAYERYFCDGMKHSLRLRRGREDSLMQAE
jgi:hypothetical protein